MRLSKFNVTSLIVGYTFLYLPILFLVVFSFNSTRSPGVWSGFSFKWYLELFENPQLLTSVFNSLKIAVISASLATSLGVVAAMIYTSYKPFPSRKAMNNLLLIPLATPEVIIAFTLLLTFSFFHKFTSFPRHLGISTIVIGHATIAISYVYMMIHTCLRDLDKSLEESALDLGATPVYVFTKITFPIIFPSIMSGWLLAFALSLDDIVLASFLSGPGSTTLPVLIFSQIRIGISPVINALATLIIFSLLIVMLLFSLIRRKRR